MDPFTIAVSVISLAGTLKELVELAERLDDSFQKLSRNKQRGDRLSAFTLDSLTRLERFYREHAETLENARELRNAMLDLKIELESVYAKTQAFVAIPSKGRLSRVKPIFNAWLNRNKVEAELVDLNGRIQECHINFCTFAVLRSNLNTHQILASTSRLEASSTTIQQDLLVIKNSNHAADGHHGAELITTLQVTRRKQTTMTGTVKHAVGHSPDSDDLLSQVSEHILAEMFLRSKVRWIDRSLTKLAKSQNFPIEHPIDYYLRPFRAVISLYHNAAEQESRRDDAIVKAVSISEVLQKHHISVSIQEGAVELLMLACLLQKLNMPRDAVTMSIWAADLFRTMVNAGPVVYQPYFALALVNLGSNHLHAGNIADATQVAIASLELHRQQLVVFDTAEIRTQLACSLVLSSVVAKRNLDYNQSLKYATEAVTICQGIREVPRETDLQETTTLGDDESDDETIVSDLGTLDTAAVELNGPDKCFHDHSRALLQLAWAYSDMGRYQEALETGRRALEMVEVLWNAFPDDFPELFAGINYFFSRPVLRPVISAEEALPYAIQSADLYRAICSNSKAYVGEYYNSLWHCAGILESLGRHDKALEMAQEMARVAEDMMENQRLLADALKQISSNLRLLKRQDEAASFRSESVQTYRIVHKATSEHEGAALHQLSLTLNSAGWHREAILAGKEAIIHYRTLATNGNPDHVKGLITAHISLARCLTSAKEYDQALDEGAEGLRLLEAMIDDEPSLLPTYLRGLHAVASAAQSEDANKSMERSQDAIRQFRKLYAMYPTETVKQIPALFRSHRDALLRCNKTQEASKWLEDVAYWCQDYPSEMPFDLMAGYLSTLTIHGDLLMKLGQPHKGLEVTVRMIDLWNSTLPEAKHSISTLYVGSTNRTEMLIYLGKYDEALESTINPIANARANPSEDVGVLAGSLLLASYATSRVGQHKAAFLLADEALQLHPKIPTALQTDDDVYWRIWGLWRLGETHADMGDHARSLDLATEAYQLALARYPSDPLWSDLRHAYVLSRFLLALQLFTTGNLESALRHLEELVEAQKDNVEVRPGYYPLYMNAIHTLCWCYCAIDRHEDGVVRRDELEKLAKRQGLVNPDIAALVHVELEAEAKRPSRTALWQKIDLQCGHQHFGGPGVVVD